MQSFNHFPEIIAAMDKAQSDVIRKTAFDLAAAMQAKIRANGQIDTGFMVNSVYVRTYDESTYSAIDQPMRKHVEAFPEVERPPDNKTAYVAVGAPYGYWQNYGTHKMPARPFLEPSVDLIRPDFEAALAAIEAKVKAAVP